jgi:multidrug efflux pump subunit AcrA (membrane-fusion protein)
MNKSTIKLILPKGVKMQKKYIGMILLVILSLTIVGCSTTDNTPSTTDIPTVVSTDARVIVDGTLMPVEDVSLAFGASARIETIQVEEGQMVSEGDVLANLANSETYLADLENAKLALIDAQNNQQDLLENAPLAYVEAWQSMIDAKTLVDQSQTDLDNFDDDNYQDRVDEAKADLLEATNDYTDAQNDFQDYADLDKDNSTRKKYEDTMNNALEKLNEKKADLTVIENEYAQLQKDLESAQATYNKAIQDMQDLQDGPKQSDLDLVQARIDTAQAQIDAAQAMIDQLTITAPFTGTVVKINYDENEFISAGTPLFIFADTSAWKVETDDLTEYDVVKIQIGQLVTLEPEADPTQTLTGTVGNISQIAEPKEGDQTYTTTIIINGTPSDTLRWGMSMNVIFE